jgi:hypothetical protein
MASRIPTAIIPPYADHRRGDITSIYDCGDYTTAESPGCGVQRSGVQFEDFSSRRSVYRQDVRSHLTGSIDQNNDNQRLEPGIG